MVMRWLSLRVPPCLFVIRLFHNDIVTPILVAAAAVASPALAGNTRSASAEAIVWLNSPATNFTESSPMGNGRLGPMMLARVDEERVVLYESSVWSVSRQDADHPSANQLPPEIRRLLIEGRNVE